MPIILGIQLMQQLCVLRCRSESLIIIRVAAELGPSESATSGPNRRHHPTQGASDTLFHSDCNLSFRTVITLALNRLLKFKRSPPSLSNTPNAALNEAILFIGAVGGLWVTLCPFKKIICFPFNGLRMTNCFQGKMQLGKLQRNISPTTEV